MEEDYIIKNQKLWDHKTDIHVQSDFYDVTSFLKGQDTLNQIELDLLGEVTNKSILHLQCHFGMDTISLSRRGARATGVDFSQKAILQATALKEELGTDTTFIQSDVYSLPNHLHDKFDTVFTSYGVIGWLPDLDKWAQTIAHFLKPGGEFVMVEFHPVVWMFSSDFESIAYDYMNSRPIIEEEEGTYADPKADIKETSITWNHGLAQVINALLQSGLRLEDFQEYNYSPYDCFQKTIKIDEKKYQIKGLENKLPMVYSIKFTK